MAYNNAVSQREHYALSDQESTSISPPLQHGASPNFQPLQTVVDRFGSGRLFMEHRGNVPCTGTLSNALESIVSGQTRTSYEMVEVDDYTRESSGPSPVSSPESKGPDNSVDVQQSRSHDPATPASSSGNQNLPLGAQLIIVPEPIVQTASGKKIPLRHPTPDLQSLQGAYTANVEHLEKTAEKLSMTSSIEDAIRQMHDEQKRSDSRRSSLLASSIDTPAVMRQFSNPNSILEINSAARLGGFIPGGFSMISPQNSISGRVRSTSRGSRFGSRPEPELEGRPLNSFVNHSMAMVSPPLSRSESIAEEHEEATTLTLPLVDSIERSEEQPNNTHEPTERPTTSASTNTHEQAQKLFTDFDGEHYNPKSKETSESRPNMEESCMSSGNRLSMARPQTYVDPNTGRPMVYYPAPVPMMLNLPPRLSNAPSAKARDKRRSQVRSSIPLAPRKSAIWLPDVLEDGDNVDIPEDDVMQIQEYVPQHQRRAMGGRRSMLDLELMPPQLRASTFFEPESISQIVEVKEESAVATLDSILDASAFAPVSAFTDHAFAGRLGAEVYGSTNKKASGPMSEMPGGKGSLKNVQKRKHLSNLLPGRRASNPELLNSDANEQRQSTVSDAMGHAKLGDSPRLEDDKDVRDSGGADMDKDADELEDGEEDEDQPDDVIYEGLPTTLLAELQIRKQQLRQRTRPLGAAYSNGMHSTLLELDAVAQVEKRSRKQKRVTLAWEDPIGNGLEETEGEDEDVPLAILFPHQSVAHVDRTRPMGLMERREMEENEPLSQRRDRLQGKSRPIPLVNTMVGASLSPLEDEDETLAQRIQRLKAQGGTATILPTARPVSGDFTTELMNQFGGEDAKPAKRDTKGKGKDTSTSPPEEEETLGQRRKRLQAEREARNKEVEAGVHAAAPSEEHPALKTRLSMADILTAHPAAGASRSSTYNMNKSGNGLLGMYERAPLQRSSTMPQLPVQHLSVGGFSSGLYNDGVGINPYQNQNPIFGSGFGVGPYTNNFMPVYQNPSAMSLSHFAQQQQMMMPIPFANPYAAMGYGGTTMGMAYGVQNPMAASMLQMHGLGQELNQGQIDMVERWRQSVMQ